MLLLLRDDSPLRGFLGAKLMSLIADGETLLQTVKNSNAYFTDYSFIVFPFAKAYEGFLKDLFFRLNIIGEREYLGHRFRIGRALNPELEKRFRRKESVYDKLSDYCYDPRFPADLWDIWKRGRNLLFHYFPQTNQRLTLKEAEYLIIDIIAVMEKALTECRMHTGQNKTYKVQAKSNF